MITISETHLQATNGQAYPLRSCAWSGDPILDACTVQADYGHLVLLTTNGTLYGINLDTGACTQLCKVDLPDMARDSKNPCFGKTRYRLHASSDGRYVAVVVDKGRNGTVVEISSGAVTMHLNGGDYHEDTVPFSACFLHFGGRNVLVHRTEWNRLDASDPATGKSLTDRFIAPYESGSALPAHYLNYFHGRLRPSPDGTRIFDDGWVWQPVSIPRIWSITDWLGSNAWESEDGTSIVELTMRDDWNTPACWISERQIAVWGLAVWDEDECEDTGQGTGVRILDVTEKKQSSDGRWPMKIEAKRVFDLFGDGVRLYVSADTGTTIWDIASQAQITGLHDFIAQLHDQVRNTLVSIGPGIINEFSIPSLVEK